MWVVQCGVWWNRASEGVLGMAVAPPYQCGGVPPLRRLPMKKAKKILPGKLEGV